MAVWMVCADCGGVVVTRDAWAEWDVGRQEWVLGAVFDDGFCHICERGDAGRAADPRGRGEWRLMTRS